MSHKYQYGPTLVEGFIDAPNQPRVQELIAAAGAVNAAYTELQEIRKHPPSLPENAASASALTPLQAERFAEQAVKAVRAELAGRVVAARLRAARHALRELLSLEYADLRKERISSDKGVGEYYSSCFLTAEERETSLTVRELNLLRGVEFFEKCAYADWSTDDSGLSVARNLVSSLAREVRVPGTLTHVRP